MAGLSRKLVYQCVADAAHGTDRTVGMLPSRRPEDMATRFLGLGVRDVGVDGAFRAAAEPNSTVCPP
jgi:hypothetical protein